MANPHPFFMLLFWLATFPLATQAGPASYALPNQLAAAYRSVLQLKVADGRRQLRGTAFSDPTHQAEILLLENYADFLEACVVQDQQQLGKLIAQQERRLALLAALSPADAWVHHAQAEVRLQLAVTNILFSNRLSAAWHLRKAFLQYQDNARRWPTFVPTRKNLGVLQVLIGSVPDQHQWFLSIVGLKGDVQEGMKNLRMAATSPNPFQQEARLLLAVVGHTLTPHNGSQFVDQAIELAKTEPENKLLHFAALHLLQKSNKGEAALTLYRSQLRSGGYLPFPYLHHLAGNLYLYQGDYQQALRENTLFLQQHKGKHYRKSAHYKLYITHLLADNKAQALRHYKLMRSTGIAETEEDKYAAGFEEVKTKETLLLLKARMHSDGGYYQQALETLRGWNPNSTTPFATRVEYVYRLARVYHGLSDNEKARALYMNTLGMTANTAIYYAPHAALQLGYLALEAGKRTEARAYFNKALRFKGHAYKNSIDAKAKLALSTL
ncbi:tetratricopeptide repeat protein [Pontibacter sp. CAU 1760]